MLFLWLTLLDKAQLLTRACNRKSNTDSLTLMESCEEDLEFTLPAALVCPHSHHSHRRHQHDIIGHCGAELILQVLNRTAAVIDGYKVPLALIRVVHLVLKKTHVDL